MKYFSLFLIFFLFLLNSNKIYADDVLAAEGWSSMVCVDFTNRKTIEIPTAIKQELEKL